MPRSPSALRGDSRLLEAVAPGVVVLELRDLPEELVEPPRSLLPREALGLLLPRLHVLEALLDAKVARLHDDEALLVGQGPLPLGLLVHGVDALLDLGLAGVGVEAVLRLGVELDALGGRVLGLAQRSRRDDRVHVVGILRDGVVVRIARLA